MVFIWDKFKRFCQTLNTEQAVSSSSHHHQSNGHIEACIKFSKHTIKKFIDTKSDTHIPLLQIRSTLPGAGLPSSTMLLFNPAIRGIMPIFIRPSVNSNNDDEHYEALVERQMKNDKNHNTSGNYATFWLGSTVAVQHEDGGLWTHGTVVGRGDHSHNMIHIINTGQPITRNSKNIKATTTTAEQYLQDQKGKKPVDTVDGILKHFERHT